MLTWSTSISVQQELMKQYKYSRPCSIYRSQDDDVQDFDTRWDQPQLAASEIPTEMVLEGLYKSKLEDSVQLQTVLALYDEETVRNNGQPSYSRLKTSVRLHIDQTMRT